MASYDFFSQPQGPTVPISLFPEAATAGIRAGNALPTNLTAGIQGALAGVQQGFNFIQQGQQIQASEQQAQIRENQIQQLPVENQIQQERLESMQLSNEINILEVERAKALEVEQLEFTREKLQNDVATLRDARKFREKEGQFTQAFQGATPQQKAQLVLGGQFSDLFAKNPELYKQALSLARPGMNEQQREAADSYLRKSAAADYWEKQAALRKEAFTQAQQALLDDSLTSTAMSVLEGYTPEELPGVIKFYPAGRFETENGKVQFDIRTGRPLTVSPDKELKGAYDAVYVDPKNPRNMQVLASAIPADSKKVYDTYRKERALQTGKVAQTAATNVERQAQDIRAQRRNPFQAQQAQAPQQAPQQGQFQPSEPAEGEVRDPFARTIQQVTKLPAADVKRLAQPIAQIKVQLSQYIRNPELRNDPATVRAVTDAKNTITRFVADKEFDESPALQSEYTQAKVDKYNQAVDAQFASQVPMVSDIGLYGREYGAYSSLKKEISNALKADSPKGLYYQKRRLALDSEFKQVFDQYLKEESRRILQPLRSKNAMKNSVQFLEAIKSGATSQRE